MQVIVKWRRQCLRQTASAVFTEQEMTQACRQRWPMVDADEEPLTKVVWDTDEASLKKAGLRLLYCLEIGIQLLDEQ